MAQESVDQTGELIRPGDVEVVKSNIFEMSRLLRDTGWMSDRTYNGVTVTDRARYCGKISALRRPVALLSTKDPNFVINKDVLRSHAAEFQDCLRGPLDEDESRQILLTYSAATAVGEFVLRRHITDPSYARSAGRLATISALFTDQSDFKRHFHNRIEDMFLKRVMSVVDDSALVQINGLRAGLTIVRAASQEAMGSDFMTDDLVLACNAALEQYIASTGPQYTGLAEYLNEDPLKGVGAFTYAIPEWLYVLGVPMSADKLMTIFDEKFVSKIGPPDESWSPSTVLIID